MEIRLRRAPGVVLPYVALSSYGRFDGRMRTSTRPILAPSAVRATVASVAGMLLVAIVSATPQLSLLPGPARRRRRPGAPALGRPTSCSCSGSTTPG